MFQTKLFIKIALFFVFIFSTINLLAQMNDSFSNDFIKVTKHQLTKNGQPYFYIGTNFWAGMNLGIAGNEAYRARLIRELDHLQVLGINNLRIMAASEGPDSEPWRMVPALQTEMGAYNEDLLLSLIHI